MKILVTGYGGQLSKEFYKLKSTKFYDFDFVSSEKFDITKNTSYNLFSIKKYDCIINCAAYTDVRNAEIERETAINVNSFAVKNLVQAAEKYNIKLVHFSTDYVYNSSSLELINETSQIHPVNFYGQSKRDGEIFIENSSSNSIIIRTSWLYSKFGNNFVNTIISKIKNNENISVVNDQYGCPTYAEDLAKDVIRIIKNERIDLHGKVYNYSNLGYTNWYNFSKKISHFLNLDYPIKAINSNELKSTVNRPKFAVTDKSKIIKDFKLKINNWEKSLHNYISKNIK